MDEKSRIVFRPAFSDDFRKILEHAKKRDKKLYGLLVAQVTRVVDNPLCGKPLRNVLRNRRRVHIGSFVLIYEIHQQEIRFLDFDHHDKIYKKKL